MRKEYVNGLPELFLSDISVDIGKGGYQELAVFLAYEGDECAFALGQESLGYDRWRNPHLMLGKIFTVQVNFQGDNFKDESYIRVDYRDDRYQVEVVSPPTLMMS